jgi:hypothetical protein
VLQHQIDVKNNEKVTRFSGFEVVYLKNFIHRTRRALFPFTSLATSGNGGDKINVAYKFVAKVGTSKRGGKQWQTTPKNLPKMQRTRPIPVA